MAQAINPRQIESARKRDDKKVTENTDRECPKCGSTRGFIVTYYDELAQDRTCINCASVR